MARTMTAFTSNSLPGWFTEGTAELIHGADERVRGSAFVDQADINNSFKKTPGSPTTSDGYSASYIAVKMMHDDLVAAGSSITAVFDRLELGDSLDAALTTVTGGLVGFNAAHGWTNEATFETEFETSGFAHLGTFNLQAGITPELDTGSIAGSDYGNPALTASDIVPNGGNAVTSNFNLVSDYDTGVVVADAQLILASDNPSYSPE